MRLPVIDPSEIQQKADQEAIHTSNVQRDYIFSWILAGLYRQSRLAEQLVLKGGNMYRKAYFPSTRFSRDLDLTSETRVDPDLLKSELNGVCEYISSNTGISFDIDRNDIYGEHFITDTESAYKVRLYFKDFFGKDSVMTLKVDLDVAQLDKLHLAPVKRPLIHPYSDHQALATDITTMRLEEALADKLKCLIQRRNSYDLFDLVFAIFIDKSIDIDKSEMVRVFLKKTIFERSPGAAKNLLLGVPFDLVKEFWSTLVCPVESLFEFETAVGLFRDGLSGLFDGFGVGRASELAFYPADLRNKIMDAGANQKLLRMRYHGATRLIEPYALKYKITNDGSGREYFWGFDRTGGNSGKSSIKAFLNQSIEELEVTDQSFEPQFEIELAKAGEIFDSLHYGTRPRRVATILGTPTPTRRVARASQTTRSLRSFGEVEHVFACPRCGKRFYRADRFNSMIKPHKRSKLSRYDNCFGGFGRYKGQKR